MDTLDLYRSATLKRDGSCFVPGSDTAAKTLERFFPDDRAVMMYWDDRSYQHLKLFFGAISAAFDNWPEVYERQFRTPEELRAWLICSAGPEWREVAQIPGRNSPEVVLEIVQTVIDMLHGLAFPAVYNGNVAVTKPISIAYKKLQQKKFNDLSNGVSQTLIDVMGVSLDDFKAGIRFGDAA